MAEQQDIEVVDYEELVDRCYDWDGSDMSELKELGIAIQAAYNDEDDGLVERFCEALLSHEDQLPPLYRAKAYAYLSTINGHDELDNLRVATSWITATRLSYGTGYIPDEVKQWKQIIKNQVKKTEEAPSAHPQTPPPAYSYPDPAAPSLALGIIDGTAESATTADAPGTRNEQSVPCGESAIPSLTLGALDGTVEPVDTASESETANDEPTKYHETTAAEGSEAGDVAVPEEHTHTHPHTHAHAHDHGHAHDYSYADPTPEGKADKPAQEPALTAAEKKQKKYQALVAQEGGDQMVRRSLAKVPKAHRMKLSNTAQRVGSGSIGALTASRLKPKKSTNFDLL